MNQWYFFFNQDRCVGCKACTIACKNWNELKRGDAKINVMSQKDYIVGERMYDKSQSYINPVTGETNHKLFRNFYMKEDWRRVTASDEGKTVVNEDGTITSTFDRRYLSMSCNHCTSPACAKVCPVGVYVKDPNTGIVAYDNTNCISCGKCADVSVGGCPFGAPQYFAGKAIGGDGSQDPNRPRMTKCDLCRDRIIKGLKPACVAACWNRALDAGTLPELEEKYGKIFEKDLGGRPVIEGLAVTGANIVFKKRSEQIK